MTTREVIVLIQKYQDGICTPEESAFLENWYNDIAGKNETLPLSDHFWFQKEARLAQILKSGKANPKKSLIAKLPLRVLSIAATLLILMGITFLLLKPESKSSVAFANDINPGGNKATLTLANGKIIQLSSKKTGIVVDATTLSYSDGTLINTAHSESFTIATPRGGTYQVRLPDGSMVWLNSATSISYQTLSKDGREVRNVKLNGEAYFEVFKDQSRPFIVITNTQEVTVLGTHFNINSYADEAVVKTTLLEGRVRVELAGGSGLRSNRNLVILKPGEEAVNSGANLEVRPGDPELAISWKEGDFLFKQESLDEVMKKISRWYDVEVEYEHPSLKKQLFGGSISKFEKLSAVLHMIEIAGGLNFELEGKKVTVRSKGELSRSP